MSQKNRKTDSPAAREDPPSSGRFSYDGLERLIHEKSRLSIMASLAAHPRGLSFNDLKDLCALTDGNLSRHLQMLVEAGLVESQHGVSGKRRQTLCRLSDYGRTRFEEYVAVLERVVSDAAVVESRGIKPRAAAGGAASG